MKPKLIGGTCLDFSLNEEETIAYFNEFGQDGWLDVEKMALRSISDMDQYEILAFSDFVGMNLSGYNYLIFHFN